MGAAASNDINMGEGALPSFLQREGLKDQSNDVPVAFLVISTLVVIGAVACAVRYFRLQLTIANSKLIRIKIVSPAPGYEIEIHELENVLALLEKFALLLGLDRSAARSMQLEFSETTLAHKLQLEPAGLCDESLCSVLGADGSVLNGEVANKANAVDIVYAAEQNQV